MKSHGIEVTLSIMTDSLQELEGEREERSINKGNMSILVGYQNNDGWGQAVSNGHNPQDKIDKAQIVFDYYDEKGYIPTPQEVNTIYVNNKD